jgi:hypothetical protein
VITVWARAATVTGPFLSQDFMARGHRSIVTEHVPTAETWIWETGGQPLRGLIIVH